MAQRQYGQKRHEELWVTEETTTGSMRLPLAGDAVKMLAVTLSDSGPQFFESEERRSSPDIDQVFQGKTLPRDITIELYAKAPATQGDLPTWMNLIKNGYGIEKIILTVLSYTALGSGKTVTVTIDGTAHILTEGAEFTAATGNNETATSLAAAIDALTGVSATASSAVITVQRDLGVRRFSITTNAPTGLEKTKVRYEDDPGTPEEATLTLCHRSDNFARWFRGCKIVSWEWGLSQVNRPAITFKGVASDMVSCGVTALAAQVPAGVALATNADPGDLLLDGLTLQVLTFGNLAGKTVTVTINGGTPTVLTEGTEWTAATGNNETATSLAAAIAALTGVAATASTDTVTVTLDADTVITITVDDARVFSLGTGHASHVIPFKIDSEEFLGTAVDYTGNTITAKRAQNSSTAAVHAIDAEVAPNTPGADPDPEDLIKALVLGSVTKGSTVLSATGLTLTQDNGYSARDTEIFESAATGFVRENPRRVSAQFIAYQKQTLHRLRSDALRKVQEALTVVLGDASTRKITIVLSKTQVTEPPDDGDVKGEFVQTYKLQALASATPGNDNSYVEMA